MRTCASSSLFIVGQYFLQATAWWTAKIMLPVSEGNLNVQCCIFEADKACHMSTDVGFISKSQCKAKCFANEKCIAAAMQGRSHATSGECWIREKTGNEDDDGLCIDDQEAGQGRGGYTVAWRKMCDEDLCEAVFGKKPDQTTTATTVAPKTTADPAMVDCDEDEYDAQPKATAAAEAIDTWCNDDSANSVLNNHLNDWSV